MKAFSFLLALSFASFFCFSAQAQSSSRLYNCLSEFHNKFSEDYKKSRVKAHIEGYEIQKRKAKQQNIMVSKLIDPVDDETKVLYVTKKGQSLCNPKAEKGARCQRPEERHVVTSLARHISILPDVYRESLKSFVDPNNQEENQGSSPIKPDEIIVGLDDCKRVSKDLKKKIMRKAKALSSIYAEVMQTEPVDERSQEAERPKEAKLKSGAVN